MVNTLCPKVTKRNKKKQRTNLRENPFFQNLFCVFPPSLQRYLAYSLLWPFLLCLFFKQDFTYAYAFVKL